MKVGRNDPCPCGSGKKYKRCCMNAITKQSAELNEELTQILAMNPDLTLDELNIVAQKHMERRNCQPLKDFCGLSSQQMSNWIYAPMSELEGIKIKPPKDILSSPVMRYLQLILDEMVANGGAIRATAKGNLPIKLVKMAGELLPEFAVAEYEDNMSLSEFSGHNEESFNALHYTKLLADIAGIFYLRSGKLHCKKSELKRYQERGVSAFFLPMLNAAATKFNWGYFDRYPEGINLSMFWVFMLWRIQTHGDAKQLSEEVLVAFPDLIEQVPDLVYQSREDTLKSIVQVRFVRRFMQYWGFVTTKWMNQPEARSGKLRVNVQPLLQQSVEFLV